MYEHKSITNVSNLNNHHRLGKLFAQAKIYNQINAQLAQSLPSTLETLELCLIKDGLATLITSNSAVAYRAKQQLPELLNMLHCIPLASQINRIQIKVNTNK